MWERTEGEKEEKVVIFLVFKLRLRSAFTAADLSLEAKPVRKVPPIQL